MQTTQQRNSSPTLGTILMRGALRRCPACGASTAFEGYLTVKTKCAHCQTPLAHFKSDDLPPYLTIFLVGHLVIGLMMSLVDFTSPNIASPLAIIIWPAIAAMMVFTVLPVIKGVVIGIHWHLHNKGALHQDSLRS